MPRRPPSAAPAVLGQGRRGGRLRSRNLADREKKALGVVAFALDEGFADPEFQALGAAERRADVQAGVRKYRTALAFTGGDAEAALWADLRAWDQARSGPRFRPAQRTCLGPLCHGRVAFASAHAGERLCKRCRDHISALYGICGDQL